MTFGMVGKSRREEEQEGLMHKDWKAEAGYHHWGTWGLRLEEGWGDGGGRVETGVKHAIEVSVGFSDTQ